LVPPEYAQGLRWKMIEKIDIAKITASENPYCVEVEKGLTIGKGFYDKLVWVE